jgi:hypothetical protein
MLPRGKTYFDFPGLENKEQNYYYSKEMFGGVLFILRMYLHKVRSPPTPEIHFCRQICSLIILSVCRQKMIAINKLG